MYLYCVRCWQNQGWLFSVWANTIKTVNNKILQVHALQTATGTPALAKYAFAQGIIQYNVASIGIQVYVSCPKAAFFV